MFSGPCLLGYVNPSTYLSCPLMLHSFYQAPCHSYPMLHLPTPLITPPRSQLRPCPLWVSQAEMLHSQAIRRKVGQVLTWLFMLLSGHFPPSGLLRPI